MRKAQRALALAGMAFVATATIGMSATSAFAAPGDHHPGNGGQNNGNGNGSGHNGNGNGSGHNGNGNGNQDWSRNGHDGDHRWDPWGHDTARVAGVFKSRNKCEVVGWLGQKAHQWDSYECDRVGRVYVLEVEQHRGDWHRHGRHH